MAVKKADVDLAGVSGMAAKFCTADEIARRLEFDKELFTKNKDVREAFESGKNAAKITLRSLLFDIAASGDRQATIFLAKNELGYRDYPLDAATGWQAPRIIDDVEVSNG